MLESAGIDCPWCGEPNEVELEPGDAGQELVQDCSVCCRPIVIVYAVAGDDTIQVVKVSAE